MPIRALVAVVALAVVSAAHAQERTLIIAPHKVPVTGVYPGLSFLATDETGADPKPLNQGIEGFVFEWGFRHTLVVAQEPVEGTTRTKLRLVREVSRQDARQGYTFEIPLTAARVVPAPSGTFYICGEKQFACADGVDAAGFARAIATGARLNCTFAFPQDRGDPLVLLGWQPVSLAAPVLAASGEIPSDAAPLVREGRTLVPLRAIFEWLGADVEYDAASRQIQAAKGARIVRLAIDSERASADGAPVGLEVPPTIVSGRTYVPLRFVTEALGAEVDWDAETRTVTVTDGDRVGTLSVP